jgi:dihydropyrimidinase
MHTHMELPFGGTTASDDVRDRHDRGGARRHDDDRRLRDAVQGQLAARGLDAWHAKADGKAAIDYGFHMIMHRLPDERAAGDGRAGREGVTSFKLFMAYPGVFLVDDARSSRRCCGRRERRPDLHARGERRGHRRARQARAGRRAHRAEVPRADAADARRPRGTAPSRWRRWPGRAGLHRPPQRDDALEKVTRGARHGPAAYAETCPQYLFLDYERLRAAGFEGAKYVMTPPLREKWNQEQLWRGLRSTTCRSSRPTTARSA